MDAITQFDVFKQISKTIKTENRKHFIVPTDAHYYKTIEMLKKI